MKIGPETTDITASERQHKHQKRFFSKTLFKTKLAKDETVSREWLLYSPSKGTVFCFACKLFGNSNLLNAITQQAIVTATRLAEHEGSESHIKTRVACVKRCADAGLP